MSPRRGIIILFIYLINITPKQNQDVHPKQDIHTPSNIIDNASRYINNASRLKNMERGGNSVIVSISKLLTVMGMQDNTIMALSISGKLQQQTSA